MPFSIRPYHRFPVCCSVNYQCGPFEGHGTVWLALLWLPLRIGEVCSLTVTLPIHQRIYVAAGIVRWVQGEEYGVEPLVIDDGSREDTEQYIWQRLQEALESTP